MRILSTIAIALAGGCTGIIGTVNPTVETTPTRADDLWETEVAPILETQAGCIGCHGTGTQYPFLAGADRAARRASLLAAPEVSLDQPTLSLLVTHGTHSGRALRSDEIYSVVEWLTAERDVRDGVQPVPVYMTKPIAVQRCAAGVPLADCPLNTIHLSEIDGAGIDGTITFKAPDAAGVLYLSELTAHGQELGVNIQHPMFVSAPPDGTEGPLVPDIDDRFAAVTMNLPAYTNEVIDVGTAAFVEFPVDNQLMVAFKIVRPYQPLPTPPPSPGGCKALDVFKTSAQPRLVQLCSSCHLDGQPKNAMDLTGIDSADDTLLATTCAQVLSHVNKTAPATSGIFIAPTTQDPDHTYRFTPDESAAFIGDVQIWIDAEL